MMAETNDSQEDYVPDYAASDLNKGLCAVGRFHGQTALYVPRARVDAIGTEKIRSLAEEVFGKQVLDSFCVSEFECDAYFLLELPPIEGAEDGRIKELIRKIMG